MDYLAIARKWRPQTFDDLMGQPHVVQTLKNGITLNRVHHAYLFCGTRGVGKTSVARIFAKALRCPEVKNATPCNVCSECVAISTGRSVDVCEIDGASNNGVEAVRSIRDNVAYQPSSGKFKIYIIDEVHMLSTSAFNALLKTLEEPPAHVIFIFATTEMHKIPLTILSRCQRFDFKRLKNSEIIERIKLVLEQEKRTLSDGALQLLAEHSDGSMRDALSLLDQALSYFASDPSLEITEHKVAEALGISEMNHVHQFWRFLFLKDVPGLLSLIGDMYQSGIDLKYFGERCLEELRIFYLVVLSKTEREVLSADELELSPSHMAEFADWSKNVSLIRVERVAQILNRTLSQLASNSLPRFLFEMAAVRMCHIDDLEKVESNFLEAKETKTIPSAPCQTTATVQNISPQTHSSHEGQNHDSWKAFVTTVLKKRPLLGALLSHANFRIDEKGQTKKLMVAFPQGGFYEKQALDSRNREEIERHAKEYFGSLEVVISSNAQNTHLSLEAIDLRNEENFKKDAVLNPSIVKMQKELGAELVDIRVDSTPSND